jgi:hypothetical protein
MPRHLKELGPDSGQRFIFSTGIENSYPVIRGRDGRPGRIDQMEKRRHYEMWREDFRLVREPGLEHLRYGPPYYRVHQGPDSYDWSFVDETFGGAYRKLVAEWRGIRPVESRSLDIDTMLSA